MIFFDKLRIVSLWLIGVLACICKWDPVVISKSLVFFICLSPCLITLYYIVMAWQIKKSFLLWYGPFFIIVLISLLYTANNIDANDIIRRCFLGFVLGFSASQLVNNTSDLKCIMKGIVIGCLITLCVTIKIEMDKIGLTRMGDVTCGAATNYSGILLKGILCLFVLNQIEKKRTYVLWELILLMGIVLSGSRMPLLIVSGVFIGLKIVESVSFYKVFVNLLKFVIVIAISAYAIMTNPILYDIAGYRFENMLYSVQTGVDENTDSSLNGRHEMKAEALSLWLTSPIYGRGVNSFWVLSPIHNGQASSHCGYTEILCSFGILGFIFFYWPFLKPLAVITRLKTDLRKSIAVILVAILITEWQSCAFDSCISIVFLYVFFQYMTFLELEEKNNSPVLISHKPSVL